MTEYKSSEIYISDVEHVSAMVDNKLVDYLNKNNDATDAGLRLEGVDWASFMGDCDTSRAVAAKLNEAAQEATASSRDLFQKTLVVQQIAYNGIQNLGATDYSNMVELNKTMDGWGYRQ